jgi:hypothetical protein
MPATNLYEGKQEFRLNSIMTSSVYDVSGNKGLTTNSLVHVKYLYGGKNKFSNVSAHFYNDIIRVCRQWS